LLKKILRKKLIILRKKKFKKVENIFFKLKHLLHENKLNFKIIGGYYPVNYEIDCLKILSKLESENYKISLPVISNKNQMDFFRWSFDEILRINKMGIPEPLLKKKVVYPDIILVPIVGFDSDKFRLGYGGGYYDRYIEKMNNKKMVTTIGLSFSFQKVAKLPIDKFDKKLDFIITEKKIFK
jgi:5-formyltetrahydrofolate cyclo-ligase